VGGEGLAYALGRAEALKAAGPLLFMRGRSAVSPIVLGEPASPKAGQRGFDPTPHSLDRQDAGSPLLLRLRGANVAPLLGLAK
jgi:hypothetical protein